MLQQLAQKMTAVIERYSRDHGYTLVVDVSNPQSPVLYASPTMDITKDIIELYDQEHGGDERANPARRLRKLATPAKPPATLRPPGSRSSVELRAGVARRAPSGVGQRPQTSRPEQGSLPAGALAHLDLRFLHRPRPLNLRSFRARI